MYQLERDPGSVAVMPLPGRGFGACQVAAPSLVYALDWWSAQPPTLDPLRGVGPFGSGRGLEHLLVVSDIPVPPEFDWIGHLPVPASLRESPLAYVGWAGLAASVASRRRWDTLVPAAARAAFLSGRSDVPGDFGAGLLQVGADVHRLDLTAPGAVPATGAIRWQALDGFPGCAELRWRGEDRGLAAALATRPCIQTVVWTDAPSTVDLHGTALTRLELSGPAVETVTLPETLHHLTLDAAGVPRRIVAPGRLTLTVTGACTTLPSGLEAVTSAAFRGGQTVSLAAAAALQGLRSLSVRWQDPAGELTGAAALTGLPGLTVVKLIGAHGLHPDTLPDLPGLRYLGIEGLLTTTAAGLQQRYRGTAVRLALGALRHPPPAPLA